MGNWCLSFLSTVYKELDPDPWLATNVQKILLLNVGIGDGTHVSGNFTLSGRSQRPLPLDYRGPTFIIKRERFTA